MTTVMIPPWVAPISPMDIVRVDTGTGVFKSQYGGILDQRQTWGDPRWMMSPRFEAMRADERGMLLRATNDSRGKFGTVRFSPNMPIRGSFGALCPELLTNGMFVNGTTGWTSSNTGQVVISVTDRALRPLRVNNSADATIYHDALTVVNGAYYAARAFFAKGWGASSDSVGIAVGNSGNSSSEYGSSSATLGDGVMVTRLLGTSSTTLNFSLVDYVAGRNVDWFYEVLFASVARCLMVEGAGQTGSRIAVATGVSSQNGLLLPGDWVELSGQICQVTAPLNTVSSGVGVLCIRPALAVAPADDSAVIVRYPFGRFMVASDASTSERYGLYSDIEFNLVETFT